jgi:hypothetical protein
MIENIFSYAFSNDEVAWLLYTLRVPPLVGMPPRLFPVDTSEAVANARLQAAAMGLVARGLVQNTPDEKLQIDPILVATLGAAVLSETLIITTTITPSISLNRTYYFAPELTVAHQLPVEGIHRFTITNDVKTALQVIMQDLDVQNTQAFEMGEIICLAEITQQVTQKIYDGYVEEAYQQLIDAGVDEQTSEAIVVAIRDQQSRSAVVVLKSREEGTQRSFDNLLSLVIYPTFHGLLALETTPNDKTLQVVVKGISLESIYTTLLDILSKTQDPILKK